MGPHLPDLLGSSRPCVFSTQDPPSPNKAPSRTRRAQRGLPKQTTAQVPEGTSLQQDPEASPVPDKGKRRQRPATSGGLSSATSSGEGRTATVSSPGEEGMWWEAHVGCEEAV